MWIIKTIIIFLFLLNSIVLSALRVWNSSGSTDANDGSNYIPTGNILTTDSLVFDNTSIINATQIAGFHIKALKILPTYTGTFFQDSTYVDTIDGTVFFNPGISGVVRIYGTLIVYGGYTQAIGMEISTTSLLILKGLASQSILGNSTQLPVIIISKGAGVNTTFGDSAYAQKITDSSGTFVVNNAGKLKIDSLRVVVGTMLGGGNIWATKKVTQEPGVTGSFGGSLYLIGGGGDTCNGSWGGDIFYRATGAWCLKSISSVNFSKSIDVPVPKFVGYPTISNLFDSTWFGHVYPETSKVISASATVGSLAGGGIDTLRVKGVGAAIGNYGRLMYGIQVAPIESWARYSADTVKIIDTIPAHAAGTVTRTVYDQYGGSAAAANITYIVAPEISYSTPAACTVGVHYTYPMTNTGGAVDSVKITSGYMLTSVSCNKTSGTLSVYLEDETQTERTITVQAWNVSGSHSTGFTFTIHANQKFTATPDSGYKGSLTTVYWKGAINAMNFATAYLDTFNLWGLGLFTPLTYDSAQVGVPYGITAGLKYIVLTNLLKDTAKIPISIFDAPLPNYSEHTDTVGVTFVHALTNIGGPIDSVINTTPLPAGYTINKNTGAVTGTPVIALDSHGFGVTCYGPGGTGNTTIVIVAVSNKSTKENQPLRLSKIYNW